MKELVSSYLTLSALIHEGLFVLGHSSSVSVGFIFNYSLPCQELQILVLIDNLFSVFQTSPSSFFFSVVTE
jgi:hypothetical protein